MTDFAKNIVVMMLTVVVSNGVTMAKIGSEIINLEKSLDKVIVKLDKFDDRLREVEIKQARYLAAN